MMCMFKHVKLFSAPSSNGGWHNGVTQRGTGVKQPGNTTGYTNGKTKMGNGGYMLCIYDVYFECILNVF